MKRFLFKIRAALARSNARQALIYGLLFAFLAQAQLAATHFHIGVDKKEQALFGLASNDAGNNGKKAPASDDCPISQLVAASHSYIGGTPMVAPLPVLVIDRVRTAFDEPHPVALIALGWQSRAPPSDLSKA